MPVMMNGEEYKWGRYGGVESDASLDHATVVMIVKWKHEVPTIPSTTASTRYATPDRINEIRITDFGFNIPSDIYTVDWDLGEENIKLDWTEFVARAHHVYPETNTSDKDGIGSDFLIINIKGHDFDYAWKALKLENYSTNRKPYFFHKIKMYPIGPNNEETQLEMIGFVIPELIERNTFNHNVYRFGWMNQIAIELTKKIGAEKQKTEEEIRNMIDSFSSIRQTSYEWADWNRKINTWIYP